MTRQLATLTKPDATLEADQLEHMLKVAQKFVASGLLPDSITRPEQALLLMQTGRELGIPYTYALRNIAIVQGRPTCSAELMLALIHRDYGQQAIRVKSSDAQACVVEYRQNGWPGTSSYTFSLDDAQRAGLAGKTTWKQYPAAMLRARCISAVARFAFPESIAGLYTPEELGADVQLTEDGEVTSISAAVRAMPAEPEVEEVADEPEAEAPNELDQQNDLALDFVAAFQTAASIDELNERLAEWNAVKQRTHNQGRRMVDEAVSAAVARLANKG